MTTATPPRQPFRPRDEQGSSLGIPEAEPMCRVPDSIGPGFIHPQKPFDACLGDGRRTRNSSTGPDLPGGGFAPIAGDFGTAS